MRIHTDTLTDSDLRDAGKTAGVLWDGSTYSRHGSRSRNYAFEVSLRGNSRRRPMGGGTGNEYAATWDQWGVFLAVLLERDQNLTIPRAYKDAEDFAFKTCDRFGAPEVVMTSEGYASVFKSYGWPDDAHGDHTFRYAGIPYTQTCTKCSAEQRWQ